MPNDPTLGLKSHEEAIKLIYESYGQTHSVYSDTSTDRAGSFKDQRYIVDRFFPTNKEARVLEVGCGNGRLVGLAQRSGYNNVAGIDASSSMIELARKIAETESYTSPDIFHFRDAIDYMRDMKSGEVDFIVAIDVIEHLQLHEILNFFTAAHAALSPGGKVLIRVPNAASSFHGRILHGDLTHYRAFTDKSLHQIAHLCGFQSVQTFESAPAPSGLKSALRAFLWKLVRIPASFSLAVETGQLRGHILTINLFSVMTR